MGLGEDVGKNAVDELTTKTLPEFNAALEDLATRLERLFNRLHGATVTITVNLGGSQ